MQNKKEFLKQDYFTKEDILEKVLAPNNYDGLRAHDDIESLWREEYKRDFTRKAVFVTGGLTLFSLYNVSRITQLSPTGKPAALLGTIFFGLVTASGV